MEDSQKRSLKVNLLRSRVSGLIVDIQEYDQEYSNKELTEWARKVIEELDELQEGSS